MLRCERCRRRYEVTVGEVYNMRVRGTTPRYCGAACMAEATRVYRLNPRGPMFCRAPVRGGCDRPRCRKGRDGDIRPFCSAHDKRRDRGQSLTAPIGRAGQRVGL